PLPEGEGQLRLFFLSSPAAAGEDGERREPGEGSLSNFSGQFEATRACPQRREGNLENSPFSGRDSSVAAATSE
ncbi:MAG: hypothetical protein KGM47_01475, partial [Acidobacteriota bacterium]|nr:hypothetical protein [Acidobacteriota bacterium]